MLLLNEWQRRLVVLQDARVMLLLAILQVRERDAVILPVHEVIFLRPVAWLAHLILQSKRCSFRRGIS